MEENNRFAYCSTFDICRVVCVTSVYLPLMTLEEIIDETQ